MQPRWVNSSFHRPTPQISEADQHKENQDHASKFQALADQMVVDNEDVLQIFEVFLKYMKAKSERSRADLLLDNLTISEEMKELGKENPEHRDYSTRNYAFGRWVDDKRAEMAFLEIMQNEIDRRAGRYTEPGIYQPPCLFPHQLPIDYNVFPIPDEARLPDSPMPSGGSVGSRLNVPPQHMQPPTPSPNAISYIGVPEMRSPAGSDFSFQIASPSGHDKAFRETGSDPELASGEPEYPPGYCLCKGAQRPPRPTVREPKNPPLPVIEPEEEVVVDAEVEIQVTENSPDDINSDTSKRYCHCPTNIIKSTSRRKRSKPKNTIRTHRDQGFDEEIVVEVNERNGKTNQVVTLRSLTPERKARRRPAKAPIAEPVNEPSVRVPHRRRRRPAPANPSTDDVQLPAENLPPPKDDEPHQGVRRKTKSVRSKTKSAPPKTQTEQLPKTQSGLDNIESVNDVVSLQRQAFYAGFDYALKSGIGGSTGEQEFFMVRSRSGDNKDKRRGEGTAQ